MKYASPIIGFSMLLAACTASVTQSGFDKSGTLTMNTPGAPEGAWHLSYEEAGKPALLQRLVFDDDSVCTMEGKVESCRAVLEAGARARVQGDSGSGAVTVRRVEILED